MNEKKFLKKIETAKPVKITKDKEILSKFYEIEGNIINLTFSFDSYHDMFERRPKALKDTFTKEAMENIESVLNMPVKLINQRITFIIKDKENHSADEIMELIKENCELLSVSEKQSSFVLKRRSIGLLLLGVIFLLTSYLVSDKFNNQITTEIINIAGTLLIWEACYRLIVERIQMSGRILKYNFLHLLCNIE